MDRYHPPRSTIIGPSFQLLSNWCSMGCAGCGIKVSAPAGPHIVRLDEGHLANVRSTLTAIKEKLGTLGVEYAMVEQSGGEPTHHPQVVEAVGEVFEESIHKIISNGLTAKSIFPYLKERGERAVLVLSIDHHLVECNQVRLGMIRETQPSRALEIHETVLENLDFFCKNNIPVVVSSIISSGNITRYLDFVAWLELRYPNQIQDGRLVPIPVSLVSFGNHSVGRMNPSVEDVRAFEAAVHASELLSVTRTRSWLYQQLISHYRNKQRYFQAGESLEEIEAGPRHGCEIYRHMISFNFQDEEILRPTSEALFQGYLCGVKVLGNIGHTLQSQAPQAAPVFDGRPSNMHGDKKYYRTDQVGEYLEQRETIINDRETVEMGDRVGYFSELRRGMCLLDDFDGVWWPFNLFLQGKVDAETVGEFWSLFRNKGFVETLQRARG